jgi:hypothetical protein
MKSVPPAKDGVHDALKKLDSGFCRNDEFDGISTSHDFIDL